MYPALSLCNAQERLQRERAASTDLDKVRESAERAAVAWHKEAADASNREQRALVQVNRSKFSDAMLHSARKGAKFHDAAKDGKTPR